MGARRHERAAGPADRALLAGLGALAALPAIGAAPSAKLVASRSPLVPRPAAAAACPGNGGSTSVFGFSRGQKLLSETSMPVCASGRLTVTFAGDPAGGCAARGLCGYAGTESWPPQGSGELDVLAFRSRGRRELSASLILGGFGSPVAAAVQRSPAPGQSLACSDQGMSMTGGFYSPQIHGGRLTVRLVPSPTALLGSGRCAGPLDVDVRHALPAVTLPVRRVVRGHAVIDLTGTRRFAAGGFAGVVRSTIVLRLGRALRRGPSRSSSTPPSGSPTRLVNVTYRLQRLRGEAVASVSSATDPAVCGPLDACGVRGTIAVAPGPARGGSIGLTAIAPARRPYRDLLAAVGLSATGDRAGISVGGGGEARVHGAVTADLAQSGVPCRDATRLFAAQLSVAPRHGRLVVSLSPYTAQAADPLRTRCPGPALGHHMLTAGSVPLSALRHPSFTVALRGGGFVDGPYRVRTRSTLRLTLRRSRVTRQRIPFRV